MRSNQYLQFDIRVFNPIREKLEIDRKRRTSETEEAKRKVLIKKNYLFEKSSIDLKEKIFSNVE